MVEISLSLCLAQLYFFAVCWYGQPAFDCHGYWLLCCHLPSSALYTPNDSLQMWTAGGWVMGRGPLWLFDPKLDANLSFYNNLEIPHFLCDFKPLLRLSCSDAHLSEDLMMVLTGLWGIGPLLCIISPYAHTSLAVAQVPSAQGKKKALATCSSHLSMVILFYGLVFATYLKSPGHWGVEEMKLTYASEETLWVERESSGNFGIPLKMQRLSRKDRNTNMWNQNNNLNNEHTIINYLYYIHGIL